MRNIFLFCFLYCIPAFADPGNPNAFSFSGGPSAISSQAGISIALTSPTFSIINGNKVRLSLGIDDYFRSNFVMIKGYVINPIYEVKDFSLYLKSGAFRVPRDQDSSFGISYVIRMEFPHQYFYYELGYYLPFWGTWLGQGLGGTLGLQVSF